MPRNIRRVLAAMLCGLAPAQTFVVDAAGGPGSSFTSIAAAVAAVPDGSVLLVQPGNYLSFTIDQKSLTVIGQPGVYIQDLGVVVTISNLAANQAVTLHALEFVGLLGPAVLQCQSCLGEIVLQSLCLDSTSGGYLTATQCERLCIVDSEIHSLGGEALSLDASKVFLSATSVTPAVWLYAGISLVDSTLEVADCTIRSGGGGASGAAIAFVAGTCSARLLGATQLFPGVILPGPLVSGVGSLRIDPSVQLLPGAAPPIEPTVVVSNEVMPAVAASTGPLGGTANGSLVGPAGGIGGLFAGLSGPAVVTPLFVDALFVDPATAVSLAVGVFGPPLQANYAVPSLASLRGVRVAWQGWSFEPTAGFQASNAVVTTHW